MKKPLRVYLDTSVIGGVFDEKFQFSSRKLFQQVTKGNLILVVSEITKAEIENAPIKVVNFFHSLSAFTEEFNLNETVIKLHNKYLDANILSKKSRNDALHVAAATVAAVDAIVSWNFKHIVRLEKIKAFNEVNLANGFQKLIIISPEQVGEHENKN